MKRDRERGVAFIEAAMWLLITLPLALGIVSVLGEMYDHNVVSKIPASVLRESCVEGMRFDGESGDSVIARHEALGHLVSELTSRGVLEAEGAVFHATNISAKACYVVYRVDTSTGYPSGSIQDGCDLKGPLAGRLTLNISRMSGASGKVGIPLMRSGATSGYFDRIVMVGVVVGGEVPNLLSPSTPKIFEFSALSVPRQEITL